jgi:GTP-binding protein Era
VNSLSSDFRSGLVPIVGRPNVGKSTLINCLVGEKIAIVSSKPQTTWNRLLGIKTLPQAQILFFDTPGIHDAASKFNAALRAAAQGALRDADCVLYMVEAGSPVADEEELARKFLAGVTAPVILVVNKIDREAGVAAEPSLSFPYAGVIRVSALTGTGVDLLVDEVVKLLPAGPPYYPEDAMTDQTERFMAGEIIREKIFEMTQQEIPYSCAVTVEEFSQREEGVVFIRASLAVAKNSHKGILIGAKGRRLKEIGSAARKDIEQLLGSRVYLDLWVKVEKDWQKKDYALKEFGLR